MGPVSWGLALGGGGPVGLAWEIGVLRAVAEAGGPEPTEASMIVGTSAGSMLGGWLRRGRSLADLEAMILEGRRLPGRALPLRDDADRQLYAEALRLWARPDRMTEEQAAAVGEVALRVDRSDPGRISSFEDEFGAQWPADGLIVTSCRVDDGVRVGWTAAGGEPFFLAIAASCTVPGQSAPLEIGGRLHVDGGVWSSTNADLLGGCGVQGALVLSPMAGAMGLGRAQKARMDSEAAALGALGVETVALDPGSGFKERKIDLLDGSKAPDALALGRDTGAREAGRIVDVLRVTNSA